MCNIHKHKYGVNTYQHLSTQKKIIYLDTTNLFD